MKKLVYVNGDNDYSVLNFEEYFGGKTISELKNIGTINESGKLALIISSKDDDYIDGTEIYLDIKDIEMDEKSTRLFEIIQKEEDYDSGKHNSFLLIEE